MKNVLLSSVAFLGLTVGAVAADLPSRMAPAPVAAVPVFTWTGFYVGVQAGYAWGDSSGTMTIPTGVLPFTEDGDFDGFVGGAHVGYNVQFGSIVAGLEADVEGTGIDGTFGRISPTTGSTNIGDSNITVQGSLRARLGFAFDRALIYATGGLAFANFETDYAFLDTTTGGRDTASFDDTEWGWTLGAGVEYAFTNNLTARLEYRYSQFDDLSHDLTPVFTGRTSNDVETEFHTIRAGLSSKFGSY
ncbi:porin family protein [Microvirga sp. BT688]|uniref:outer membrane protein n=1 Tax=Microvirga sp. TaxID=1873136 RepID=UPI0016828603|nr:outer membrane protein [Microvirga sp.]MBD2746792.1 porin family protein [Microvirga sp.]